MPGVSPKEIDAAVGELNSIYDADDTAYCIQRSKAGYRMVLRDEFRRVRDKFYGRVKEARLSPWRSKCSRFWRTTNRPRPSN